MKKILLILGTLLTLANNVSSSDEPPTISQESENLIPPQWFFLFENAEKKFFYSHAGDGAIQPDGIYYNTDSASSKKRITDIIDSFSSLNSGEIPKDLDFFLKELQFGLSEILLWISKGTCPYKKSKLLDLIKSSF